MFARLLERQVVRGGVLSGGSRSGLVSRGCGGCCRLVSRGCRAGLLGVAALRLAVTLLWSTGLGITLLGSTGLGGLAVRTFAKELDVVHYHLRGVTVGSGLVCPLTGAEAAFNEHLTAFVDKLFCEIGRSSPCHNAVPFSVFLPVAAAVCVTLSCGKAEGCNLGVGTGILGIVLKVTYFGIIANVTDKHNFV